MFERAHYKQLAKRQLKGRRAVPALATLITLLIFAFLCSTREFRWQRNQVTPYTHLASGYIWEPGLDEHEWTYFQSAAGSDVFLSFITISIAGILVLAQCYLYGEYFRTTGKIGFSEFLKGLSLWIKGALAMLWFVLWTFLWSLLFLIPGIVKGFSYSQMFFILAETPDIGVTKAMRLSRAMTKGFKGDLFIMCLSFLGWEILSIFTLGILQLWIIPYQYMSFTNAYKDMKAQAIRTGVLLSEDFNQ